MIKTEINQSGIRVSLVGLGTVKIGRNTDVKYPAAFSLPDDKSVQALLDKACDLGVNLLDTAPAYGSSEARLGKLIKSRRKDWILSTKVGENYQNQRSSFDFTGKGTVKSIENSLKQLQTDYLDIVFIHSDGNDSHILEFEEVVGTLKTLKQKGLIRLLGMSTKTVEGAIKALSELDMVMAAFNLQDQSQIPVFREAAEKNKAVFIKKAFGSGHLSTTKNIHSTFELLRDFSAVKCVVSGTLNTNHLEANVTAATEVYEGLY